jgi:hypothetical protein
VAESLCCGPYGRLGANTVCNTYYCGLRGRWARVLREINFLCHGRDFFVQPSSVLKIGSVTCQLVTSLSFGSFILLRREQENSTMTIGRAALLRTTKQVTARRLQSTAAAPKQHKIKDAWAELEKTRAPMDADDHHVRCCWNTDFAEFMYSISCSQHPSKINCDYHITLLQSLRGCRHCPYMRCHRLWSHGIWLSSSAIQTRLLEVKDSC